MIRNVEIGICVFVVANLVFTIWVWRRARPGSGDAMFMPPVIFLSVAMLMGLLPRVLWPAAQGFQIGMSVASMILAFAVTMVMLRRSRRLRRRRSI